MTNASKSIHAPICEKGEAACQPPKFWYNKTDLFDSLDDWRFMVGELIESDLVKYILDNQIQPGDRLPPLTELSSEIGVSVGKLREQLELMRGMGFVSVQPRLGIRRESFDFYPAVSKSLLFGLATGEAAFDQFSQLRQTIETNMWSDAVSRLTDEDIEKLEKLVGQAWVKLRDHPAHVPNGEHRELHLTFFHRLNNPFVQALLKAYWDAYDLTELTRFADYQYWIDVWKYHEQIVKAVREGDIECGQRLLIEHFQLLPTVTIPS